MSTMLARWEFGFTSSPRVSRGSCNEPLRATEGESAWRAQLVTPAGFSEPIHHAVLVPAVTPNTNTPASRSPSGPENFTAIAGSESMTGCRASSAKRQNPRTCWLASGRRQCGLRGERFLSMECRTLQRTPSPTRFPRIQFAAGAFAASDRRKNGVIISPASAINPRVQNERPIPT
jgi:hypothetical protein